MAECLFNTCSDNVAGYCRYHKKCMTVKQIRTKQCLQKQCGCLIKNEDHQYWHQREVQKAKRKARKERFQYL